MKSRDKYRNFAELIAAEREGQDFSRVIDARDSGVTVIAPHGGGIERGTSEISVALAGDEFSLYCFEGLKAEGNYEALHITSTNFDDPVCVQMVEQSSFVLAVHGCEGNEQVVFVGGHNEQMKTRIIEALKIADFQAEEDISSHSGQEIHNICNRGVRDGGVQLEITEALRRSMFRGFSRRERQVTTPVFDRFVNSIREVLTNREEE